MFYALIIISHIVGLVQDEINIQTQNRSRYENLSNKFIYEISTKKKRNENYDVITNIYITIINKSDSKITQSIHKFGEDIGVLFGNTFMNPFASRSYSTGFKRNTTPTNGDYGDIIVGDFNFDGKEDFAIKKGTGYASFYDFYIQNNENKFVLDLFLSKENLGIFPKFDFAKKSALYSGIIGVNRWWEKHYSFNAKLNKWILMKTQTGSIVNNNLNEQYNSNIVIDSTKKRIPKFSLEMIVNKADYVCGIPFSSPLDINDILEYNNLKYGFCSEECKNEFKKNPNLFIKK